jgi:hypothetical protein
MEVQRLDGGWRSLTLRRHRRSTTSHDRHAGDDRRNGNGSHNQLHE